MEHPFNFKQKIKTGQPLIGTLQTLNSTEITEILINAGFDWLWIDLEHSAIDIHGGQKIVEVAGIHCPCLVRVPSAEEVWIKKILDTGPAGIIVPQIRSAKHASQIVSFSRYPPMGARSVGISRAQGYGLKFQDYINNANDSVALILQIEHIDAVNQIEEIVAIPGIDALIIGPYDLSGSMGKMGQVNDPDVQKKIAKVRQVCLKAKMPMGIFTANPKEVKNYQEQGYVLIAVGIDCLFLGEKLTQVRNSIPPFNQ